MDLEPTLGPRTSDQGSAEETRGFNCDAIDTSKAAAVSQVDRRAAGKRKGAAVPAAGALNGTGPTAIVEPRLSSVAGTMCADRGEFLQSLCQAVDADISPAARRGFRQGGDPSNNESTAFERLVAVAVDAARPQTAAEICAALAARTVARSLVRAENAFDTAAGEALLLAWLDTARAIVAARGSEGLRRLLPTARLVASKCAGRESAPEIAASLSRVAARIAADTSLERAFGASP